MDQEVMTDNEHASAPTQRKPWKYASAGDVLPPDLLSAVQEHFSGGTLYVPPPTARYYAERRKLVLSLRLRGVSTAEIANLAHVSPRRVRQILAQVKRKLKK